MYRIEVLDLDPLRLVLLGTALEVAVLVFEVPTGVLADTVRVNSGLDDATTDLLANGGGPSSRDSC